MPRLEPLEDSDLTDLSETSDNDNEIVVARSSRPKRQTKKACDNEDEAAVSDAVNSHEEDVDLENTAVNADDSDSSLSLPPASPPRKKLGRPRKSSSAISKPAESGLSTIPNGKNSKTTPSQQDRPAHGRGNNHYGRGGGNKRKHPHEYCLTCANYGRACSGRRDGHPGCAVCREPDRSKGEKLRECLWAEPEKGIFTYAQAKEVLKIAQAEERARQGKAPTKRQLPFLSEELRKKYLSAPDTIGLSEAGSRATATAPPLSRPLNVRPPPAIRPRQMLSLTEHATVADPYRAHEDDLDTIIVNRAATSPGLSSTQKLFIEKRSSDVQSGVGSANTNSTPHTKAKKPVTDATGRRIPYYDPALESYVLPAYPHSNLLPPHMKDKFENVGQMSVYDAYPFLPMVMPVAARPHRRQSRHWDGRSDHITPISSDSPPRPLDKTGTPTRRYSRSDSVVSGVSGYDISLKMWKAPAIDHSDSQVVKATTINETLKVVQESGLKQVNSAPPPLSIDQSDSAQAEAGSIEAPNQPQLPQSGSLSPQEQMPTEQGAILPAKYAHIPEKKRKRVSGAAPPHVISTQDEREESTKVVDSIEIAIPLTRNGRESSLSSATSLSTELPPIGKFSRPPIAEIIRQRPSWADSSLVDAPLTSKTPTIRGAPPPVVGSGWQAVNTVKKSMEVVVPKTSPLRLRKKRRTITSDVQGDSSIKQE